MVPGKVGQPAEGRRLGGRTVGEQLGVRDWDSGLATSELKDGGHQGPESFL